MKKISNRKKCCVCEKALNTLVTNIDGEWYCYDCFQDYQHNKLEETNNFPLKIQFSARVSRKGENDDKKPVLIINVPKSVRHLFKKYYDVCDQTLYHWTGEIK